VGGLRSLSTRCTARRSVAESNLQRQSRSAYPIVPHCGSPCQFLVSPTSINNPITTFANGALHLAITRAAALGLDCAGTGVMPAPAFKGLLERLGCDGKASYWCAAKQAASPITKQTNRGKRHDGKQVLPATDYIHQQMLEILRSVKKIFLAASLRNLASFLCAGTLQMKGSEI